MHAGVQQQNTARGQSWRAVCMTLWLCTTSSPKLYVTADLLYNHNYGSDKFIIAMKGARDSWLRFHFPSLSLSLSFSSLIHS